MTVKAATQVSQKPIEVTESQIACDGGGGALGHPRVYLTMGADRTVECPYCDQKFVLKAGASGGHGH